MIYDIIDLRQSPQYGKYMTALGWKVEKIEDCQVFIRSFPLIGSIIKIQRPNYPIPFKKIEKIAKKYQAFKISIEPQITKQLTKDTSEVPADLPAGKAGFTSEVKAVPTDRQELVSETFSTMKQLESSGYKKSNSPYLPTKTIHINLTQAEKKIFNNFSTAKRRAVRRARKNKIVVKESDDIKSFIKLKSRQFFPLGFFVRKDITALWQTFYPENVCLLLAFNPKSHNSLAGVLLLFNQNTAHYWLAASTKKGNKLFAPTLLVWEGLKLAKKRGCKIFDFEGIYDSRFHKATKSWQGFTKFKKGFGGREIEYPGCFVKTRFLF